MARRKKTENKDIAVSNVEPTDEEISYALNFAKKYFTSPLYDSMFGTFNPMMSNMRLQDTSFSPAIGTSEEIEKALNNPKNSERELVSFGQNLEVQSMLYKRMLNYMGRMLSFDLNYVCINADVDYNDKQFKKDKGIISNFFDKFDIVNEFTSVMEVLVREEAMFTVLRTDGNFKWGLQQLPSNYCLITGRTAGELLFDYNMIWFMQPGIDINLYPPIFKEYYEKAFSGKGYSDKYIPSAPLNDRDGSWTYYVQTSPDEGFTSWKLFPQLATRIPLFSAMYPDIALQPLYRQLAKTNAMQSAVRLLVGEVGLLKDAKGGNLSNAFSIDSGNLAKFLQLVRSSIDTTIGISAAPLQNITSHEFKLNDRNVYDESLSISAANSGSNARMFYATADKQNIFESEQNLSVDEYLIAPAYRMFETFLNRHVNKLTKKYKFKFMLSGTNFAYDKKRKMSNFTTMANMGIFNPSLAASSMGMNVFDLERMMTQVKAEKWEDKVTMITPLFQQSAEQQAGKGRPQKADEDLSEEGSDTRDSGSNLLKGGKI